MELQLIRRWFTERSTIGELAADGYDCFTLEDRVRAPGVKVYGETAIPAGRYQVRISFSPHFQRRMPEVVNVPGFTGIRIHSGNIPRDTLGCILTGTERGEDKVLFSRAAFYPLLARLEAAQLAGETSWITITDLPDREYLSSYQRLTAA